MKMAAVMSISKRILLVVYGSKGGPVESSVEEECWDSASH